MATCKIHPLGGLPVKNWLKLLVAFDVIVTSIALHLVVLGIAYIIGIQWKLISEPEGSSSSSYQIYLKTMIVIAVFLILDILLDVWIWILIPKGDELKCKIWFLMKITLEICDGIGFIVEISLGYHTMVYILPMILDFLFSGYFLWVVATFLAELMMKKGDNKGKTAPIIPLDVKDDAFVKFFKTADEEVPSLNTTN